jgi:hypothetical protein
VSRRPGAVAAHQAAMVPGYALLSRRPFYEAAGHGGWQDRQERQERQERKGHAEHQLALARTASCYRSILFMNTVTALWRLRGALVAERKLTVGSIEAIIDIEGDVIFDLSHVDFVEETGMNAPALSRPQTLLTDWV